MRPIEDMMGKCKVQSAECNVQNGEEGLRDSRTKALRGEAMRDKVTVGLKG